MSDKNLRSRLIRLAHSEPGIRSHLLPILAAVDLNRLLEAPPRGGRADHAWDVALVGSRGLQAAGLFITKTLSEAIRPHDDDFMGYWTYEIKWLVDDKKGLSANDIKKIAVKALGDKLHRVSVKPGPVRRGTKGINFWTISYEAVVGE